MSDPARPPLEYTIDLLTDPACAKDIVKGILHTIFFHRTFTAIRPLTREILSTTLPVVSSPDLESLIDARATALVRRLESAISPHYQNGPSVGPPSCPITVTFHELRRTKAKKEQKSATSYFVSALSGLGGLGGAKEEKKEEDEVCWESWTVRVYMQRARTEGEAEQLRYRMEDRLRKAGLDVMELASREKDHIPPIVSVHGNPFPYKVTVGEVVWDDGIR